MDTDNLIKAIELAFDRVERSGTSLRQFVLTDKFGMSREISADEWAQAGRNRADTKWQDIPDSEIEECDCQLAHMQAKEFLYYLPAYMRYSVKHYKSPIWETDIIGSTVDSLYPSSKDSDLKSYTISQLSLLNGAQKLVIVQFLNFVESMAEDVQRPYATVALERFWNHHVGT
ncbi:MAG: hypothetical protein B7Y56_15860 [Gallionellales bacterium 35-53-114]|jgi:hypothetical protein|nr:MAG: hypothetical protein B7Y56_15860 [Gallionellales bacterium 35-53-114]HQS60025.1 hypothetical protein [Gallionellaceae bacterium]